MSSAHTKVSEGQCVDIDLVPRIMLQAEMGGAKISLLYDPRSMYSMKTRAEFERLLQKTPIMPVSRSQIGISGKKFVELDGVAHLNIRFYREDGFPYLVEYQPALVSSRIKSNILGMQTELQFKGATRDHINRLYKQGIRFIMAEVDVHSTDPNSPSNVASTTKHESRKITDYFQVVKKGRISHCFKDCSFGRVNESANPMIACDDCGLWYHNKCVDDRTSDRPKKKNISWFCSDCKSLFKDYTHLKNEVHELKALVKLIMGRTPPRVDNHGEKTNEPECIADPKSNKSELEILRAENKDFKARLENTNSLLNMVLNDVDVYLQMTSRNPMCKRKEELIIRPAPKLREGRNPIPNSKHPTPN